MAGPGKDAPDVDTPCGHCGQQIPADSIFCPMCGNKTALPGGITVFELPRVVLPEEPVPETRTLPAATPPPARVRAPALVVPDPPEPDQAATVRAPTVLVDLPAVVPDPPPVATALSGPPSTFATRMPITPRPLRIVLGCLFLAVAVWLALWFLPRHRPLSASEEQALTRTVGEYNMRRIRHTRFTQEVHDAGFVGSGGLALAGLGLILSGAFYRSQVWVRCRRCRRRVIAWKGAFGLHCPQGAHYARVQLLMVILTALFWTALVAVAGLICLWLLGYELVLPMPLAAWI